MARNLKVEARLIADTGAYTAGIRKAIADTDRFGKSTRRVGKQNAFGGIAKNALKAAAATASLYTVYDQGKKAVNTTLDLAKSTKQLTRTTGLSTQEASRFISVAKVRGIETTKLAASFTILSKQIVAAQKGSEGAVSAFQKLGVSQEAIRQGNTREVFLQAADGLSKMANGANKTALAAQLFGRGYQALFPLLDMGSKGIAEQLQLAGDLGAELSGKGSASVLKFAEAQRKAKLAQIGLQVQLGQVLIPLLTKGVSALSDFIVEFRNGEGAGGRFRDALENIKSMLEPVAALLADQPQLLVYAGAAYVAFKGTIMGINLYSALMTAFGPVSLYEASGKVRGMAFGIGFGRMLTVGIALGMLTIPILIATALERAGAVFQQWVTRNMGPELKKALGIPENLDPLSTFGPWFENLKLMAKQTWSFIGRIFSSNPLSANPFGKMSDWFNGIKTLAKGAWDFIKRLFGGGGSSNLFGTIRAPKIAGLDGMVKSVKTAINKAVGAVTSAVGRFVSAGAVVAAGLISSVRSTLSKLPGQVGSAISRAAAAVRAKVGSMVSAGASLAAGVATGIRNSVSSVLSAARDLAASIPAKIRKLLGINSPSTVFMAIGEDMVAGMAMGLQKTGPIAKALKKVVPKAPPGVGSGKYGVGGSDLELTQAQVQLQQRIDALGNRDDKAAKRAISRAQADLRRIEAELNRREAINSARDQLRGIIEVAKDTYRAALEAGAQRTFDNATKLARAGIGMRGGERERAADLTYLKDKKSLEEEIARAQGEAANPAVQARYEARKAALQARFAAQQQAGNLEAADQTQQDLVALEERYGPQRVQILQDQLATLNRDYYDVLDQRTIDSAQAQLEATQAGIDGQVEAWAAGLTTINGLLNGQVGNYVEWVGKVNTALGALGYGLVFALDPDASTAINPPKKLPKVKKKKRASGGMLSRTGLTLVGETGPELIANGNVMSATRTARTSGAGVTLNVYPQTTADDPVALARALGWQLATR